MIRKPDFLIAYTSRVLRKKVREWNMYLKDNSKKALIIISPMLRPLGKSSLLKYLRARVAQSGIKWFEGAFTFIEKTWESAPVPIETFSQPGINPGTHSNRRRKQLLFEVTVIASYDPKTGIQRVVRAQLQELLRNVPSGYEVEPIYLANNGIKPFFRYAKKYKSKILGRLETEEEKEIIVSPGDVFYCAELNRGSVIQAFRDGVYRDFRDAGVSVNFLIYDLLPITMPNFFEKKAGSDHAKWMRAIAKSSDRLICISRAVRDDVVAWMSEHYPAGLKDLRIEVVHLGADIVSSMPSKGFDRRAADTLARIGRRLTFLMVGTMEPRKGYSQTLRAFERLWRKGLDINLVIVGKEGWDMEAAVSMIISNTETDRRLFWLTDISDEFLEKLYSMSACLIAASEGEGFGLPLIEAAQHGLPIIARDIPVFREVADGSAFFFSGLKPADLASAIEEWIRLFESDKHPKSKTMRWLTWEESVGELAAILTAEPRLSASERRSRG